MSNLSRKSNETGSYVGGIPLNVTLHAWPVPNHDSVLKLGNETGPGLVTSIGSAQNNSTDSLHNLNATGYVAIDDDLTDTGFTDVQTFILASIATILPLMVVVITILGIRIAWKRYRVKKEEGYEGVLQKEESCDPSTRLQGYSLPQELKTSESQFTVTPGDESLTTPTTHLPTLKSNGSIITMTLKNNHLIVETEETLNTPTTLKIESKGTTTTFVTPAEPDFRGEPPFDREHESADRFTPSDHGAQVHCSPEDAEDELDKGSCNTGLSQSDLSVSSTESQNPSYRYGNQSGYDTGAYGYPEYSGYNTNAQTWSQPSSSTKPKEHRAYYRSPSVIERTDSVMEDEDPLKMSDIHPNHVKIQEQGEKRYQHEQERVVQGQLPTESMSICNENHDGLSNENQVPEKCHFDAQLEAHLKGPSD